MDGRTADERKESPETTIPLKLYNFCLQWLKKKKKKKERERERNKTDAVTSRSPLECSLECLINPNGRLTRPGPAERKSRALVSARNID